MSQFPFPPLRMLPVLLLLGACSSNAPQNRNPQPQEIGQASTPMPLTAGQLLEQSLGLPASDATPLLLQAAALLRDNGDLNSAQAVLSRIQNTAQPPAIRTQIQLLRADIALARNLPREALALLQENTLPPLPVLATDQQLQIRTKRATALAATGATLDSALELIALESLAPATIRRANHDSIWQKLSLLPQQKLLELIAGADDEVLRGWYELALATATTSDMDRQLVGMQQWRTAWSTHPAALVMPPQLEVLEMLGRERPQRIALLLPLATSAGVIVRDAFMGAYYHLQDLGGQVPVVKLYDTTDATDIRQLHLRARQEGAQLIIGPLLKQQVAELQGDTDLGVPTLALNSIEGSVVASPLLYQFALSPEDEARQLAEKAWADGHRRVAILSPGDEARTEVATRKRDSFRSTWEKLGGTLLALDSYGNDYTDSISRMLLLQESSERHKHLNQLLGRTTVAQLRRRQDVDCIYLVAQPAAARQIVPSLSYLYAGDIPVYAAQDLYSGAAKQTDDRDLNGVIFGESPWLLGDAGDSGRVRQLFPVNSAQNLRLQAFGIDAFRLYPRLRLLESGADAVIPGASGNLKLGPNHTITRKLDWATISDGLITPLNR